MFQTTLRYVIVRCPDRVSCDSIVNVWLGYVDSQEEAEERAQRKSADFRCAACDLRKRVMALEAALARALRVYD